VKTETARGLPRLAEASLCTLALVLLSPVLAVIALGVALTSDGPILFRQERAGLRGVRFTIFKFRTMRVGGVGPSVTAKTDPRITALGQYLRKTKLDELPQLWNVVRGDLSLVGPRPEAIPYVDLNDAAWQEVLSVRPGITDPITLRLRNEEEILAAAEPSPELFYREFLLPYKLSGYRDYVARRTWWWDISVIWATLLAVVVPTRAPVLSPGDIVAFVQRLQSFNPRLS
jgi:lipopolysaccharide/colanic/teichoic acid biosynthesis glycosyltransferase